MAPIMWLYLFGLLFVGRPIVATALGDSTVVTAREDVEEMQSSRGPRDTPQLQSRSEADRLLGPHIAVARRSLPEAKRRYLQGLPKGSTFFVTIAVNDGRNKENAYVQVKQWNGEQIVGVVATKLIMVHPPKFGDKVVISEGDVIDWTITLANGREEGNFIGKYLDSRKE